MKHTENTTSKGQTENKTEERISTNMKCTWGGRKIEYVFALEWETANFHRFFLQIFCGSRLINYYFYYYYFVLFLFEAFFLLKDLISLVIWNEIIYKYLYKKVEQTTKFIENKKNVLETLDKKMDNLLFKSDALERKIEKLEGENKQNVLDSKSRKKETNNNFFSNEKKTANKGTPKPKTAWSEEIQPKIIISNEER